MPTSLALRLMAADNDPDKLVNQIAGTPEEERFNRLLRTSAGLSKEQMRGFGPSTLSALDIATRLKARRKAIEEQPPGATPSGMGS